MKIEVHRTTALVACIAVSVGAPRSARAQDCDPGDESNEARTMAILSVPMAFTRGAAPMSPARRFQVGLEAATLPDVPADIATPTICRPGKGPENVNKLPGLVRPRASLAFGPSFVVEAGWIPPVRVNGVKANLFSVAAGWVRPLSPSFTLGLRGFTTLGEIRGPITCDDDALEDPASECFNGQESDDQFQPNLFGVDVSVGAALAGGRWRPYGGVGYTHSRPRFQVNFTNAVGDVDTTKVRADLDRMALYGGLSWVPGSGWDVSGEVYSTPADAVTVRVIARGAL